MNNVHDMGGMNSFGPVFREQDEPNFHEDWERRVFALTLAGLGGGLGPVDAFRHAIERMEPTSYLRTTYYEHWLSAVETRAADIGLFDAAVSDTPMTPDVVDTVVSHGAHTTRDVDRTPKFKVGDKVRAKNLNPTGHTRLPRYARGRLGTIEMLHGNHVYPDTVAHDRGEDPQPLYAVRFSARELWGPDANAHDTLCVDLWESYLEEVK